MFTLASNPDWFKHLQNNEVLQALQNDLFDRDLGRCEFQG